MSGPVALPERGLALPADRPVQRTPPAGAGQTGPIALATPHTLNAPMPLGALYGGTHRMYLPGVLPVPDPRSDFHSTDPWLPRFVAIPRRGQYGSDSHILGPAAPGGARGLRGLNTPQKRRVESPMPGVGSQIGGLGRFLFGSILSMLSPRDVWAPSRPYFANVYGTQGYQPTTRNSLLALGAVSARPVDPGKVDNKRYDQASIYEGEGTSNQRFLALPRDRIDRYQRTNIKKLGTRPQMKSPHDYQLANIPPANSVGSATQQLQTTGQAGIPPAG